MKKILLGTLMALSLSLSASASVTTATQDDGFNLHLSYPAIHTDKASTTVTINKFIRLYTDEAIKAYRSNRYDEVSMHYETTFENDRYVSVILHVLYQGKYLAHPENYAYGLIFDKRTGDRADLSSEVIWPSPASILKGLSNKEYVLLNEQDQSVDYDGPGIAYEHLLKERRDAQKVVSSMQKPDYERILKEQRDAQNSVSNGGADRKADKGKDTQ